MIRSFVAGVVLALLAGAAVAAPDIPSGPGYARLDRIAEVIAATPWCEQLGYPLDVENSDFEKRVIDEAEIAGLSRRAAKTYLYKQMDRESDLSEAELDAAVKAIGAEPDHATARARFTAFIDKQVRLCAEASVDPIARLVVGQLDADQVAAGRVEALDRWLQIFGYASWQDELIRARSLLIMLVGTCESRLDKAERTDLVGAYLDGPEPADALEARKHRHYAKAYQEGRGMGKRDPMTAAECQRALAARMEDVAAVAGD